MFPGDPLLAEMEAACNREHVAYAVYMKCQQWRLLWQHEDGAKKHLRAFLRNPEWPTKALTLCAARGIPAPTWVLEWAVDLANGLAKASNVKNKDTAKRIERALNEISEAMYTTPPPQLRRLDEAANLNDQDARRLRKALLEVNDAIGIPRAATKTRGRKTGKN